MPTVPTVIVCAILLALIAIAAALITAFGRTGRTPLWLVTVFAILFLFAFLTWAAADLRPIPVPGLLGGALVLSVPLIFGALGGVISERVGVVNVAIEGQLLFGAFTAALVGSITQNAVAGLLAAAVAGMLVSFVLAAFSIKYFVDQVIVGVVLNVLVIGLTSFFYSKVFTGEPGAQPDRQVRHHPDPAALRHPDPRTGAVQAHDRRVPDVRRRLPGLVRAVQDAAGACASVPSASTPPRPTRSAST